jgi:uncharacterized membrane protein YhaH (DUF805 family)
MGGLKKYFTLKDRLSVLEYWRFQVRLGLAAAVVISATAVATSAGGWLGAFPFAFIFPLLAAGISVVVRRLHDRGKSAWWLLLFLVAPGALAGFAEPLAGSNRTAAVAGLLMLPALILWMWFWIEIAIIPGQKRANRYGPDPRAKSSAP